MRYRYNEPFISWDEWDEELRYEAGQVDVVGLCEDSGRVEESEWRES
jgi:hypothetical protein